MSHKRVIPLPWCVRSQKRNPDVMWNPFELGSSVGKSLTSKNIPCFFKKACFVLILPVRPQCILSLFTLPCAK